MHPLNLVCVLQVVQSPRDGTSTGVASCTKLAVLERLRCRALKLNQDTVCHGSRSDSRLEMPWASLSCGGLTMRR